MCAASLLHTAPDNTGQSYREGEVFADGEPTAGMGLRLFGLAIQCAGSCS